MVGSSDTYTHGHHDSVLRSHRWRTAENSAAYLLPRLRPGMTLLDVGCGPGTITADLAEVVSPGAVVGLDAAEEPLAGGRAEAQRRELSTVDFVAGDVYRLGYPDDAFDVVHAHQVLQHLTDPVAALAQMRRVCRPGGTVAVRDADYTAMSWYPREPGLQRWLELYLAVAREVNGAEPAAAPRLSPWVRAAGFDDVRCSASAWCYSTPDERAWWGELWAERVTRSRLAEQALAAGLADRDELAAIAAAWRRWARDPHGWFGILNGEVLCRA